MVSPSFFCFFCFQTARYNMLKKFSQFAVLREAEEGKDPTYGFKRGDIVQAWAGDKSVVAWVGTRAYQSHMGPTVDLGVVQQNDKKDYEKVINLLAAKDYTSLHKMQIFSYPAINIVKNQGKVKGNIEGATPEQIKQLTDVETAAPQSAGPAGSDGGNKQLYHLDQKNGSFVFTPAGQV